jgi:hypothetical protein
MILSEINGEGGSSFVQHRPQLEPLDDVERFLAKIRFNSREKLKDIPLEIGK